MASTRPTSTDARKRRFGLALCALCVLGAASQALILSQTLAHDPFGATPINDGKVYWQWAGEIAGGRLVGSTPFLSAPLYPYMLGLVRALGGGLASVYALQALLHIATAALLARIAARRFSLAVAWIAALLYLLLGDPAYFTGRVLNCTLQAFLTVLLWDRLIAFEEDRRPRRALVAGAVLGLQVLANPTFMVAVPLVAAWAAWIGASTRDRVRLAGTTLASALLVIAPATLHNVLACGEWIPVSAQAGLGFYHGNAPGADGTYHAAEGVSTDRVRQNLDAMEAIKASTDGSYKQASSAYFAKGLAWWRAEPAAAAHVAWRKFRWFHSGRNYGDIYIPALEIEDGFASRLVLAPLPVAWIALPALLVCLGLMRSARRQLPALLLYLVPLATVTAFWYSPRYRLPAVPVMCVFAALSLVVIASWRTTPLRALVLAAAWIAAIALGPLDRVQGFDRVERYRAAYEQILGNVFVEQRAFDQALVHYRRAVELGAPDASASLGDVLRRTGQHDEALQVLRASVRSQPSNAYARRSLAVALAQARMFDEALEQFEAALRLDPNDLESLSGAGNVELELGHAERAIDRYQAALERDPRFATAHFNLGCAYQTVGRVEEAEQAFARAARFDPELLPAYARLAASLAERGDFAQARTWLGAGLARAPEDTGLRHALAWLLATAPDARVRDGASALELANELERASGGRDPAILDTLAAAQAELGRFDEAIASISRALELVRDRQSVEYRAQLERRLALYGRRQPFRQTSP